jgi:hypothetical protein
LFDCILVSVAVFFPCYSLAGAEASQKALKKALPNCAILVDVEEKLPKKKPKNTNYSPQKLARMERTRTPTPKPTSTPTSTPVP